MTARLIRIVACSVGLTMLYGQEPANLEQGKIVYEGQCAPCHGATGEGGYGPPLNRRVLSRAATDAALFRVIKGGLPGTNMPGFGLIEDVKLQDVVRYVRSLGTVEKIALPGDPVKGKSVYDSKGCASCHVLGGKGNGFGPDLTDVGARRSAAYLRNKVMEPGNSVSEGYWTVRVAANDGRDFRALWVNEDSFTIQARDAAGKLYSFRKADLKNYERLEHVSLMPSFASTLNDREIDDLVAYLAERGIQ